MPRCIFCLEDLSSSRKRLLCTCTLRNFDFIRSSMSEIVPGYPLHTSVYMDSAAEIAMRGMPQLHVFYINGGNFFQIKRLHR
jgi:hypothetical protein